MAKAVGIDLGTTNAVAITLLALAMFGYVKGHFTGTPPWRSAMQTVLIGGGAAGGAFVVARALPCWQGAPQGPAHHLPRRGKREGAVPAALSEPAGSLAHARFGVGGRL